MRTGRNGRVSSVDTSARSSTSSKTSGRYKKPGGGSGSDMASWLANDCADEQHERSRRIAIGGPKIRRKAENADQPADSDVDAAHPGEIVDVSRVELAYVERGVRKRLVLEKLVLLHPFPARKHGVLAAVPIRRLEKNAVQAL